MMRCEECQAQVEDYFDGELDEQTTEHVAQHMAACAICASAYQRLERERELYLSYECDAQAAPAFWDNVIAQAALAERSRSSNLSQRLRRWFADAHGNFRAPRFSPMLTASIVLAAIGITIVVMVYINSRGKSADTARISRKEGAPPNVPSPTPTEIAAQSKLPEDTGTGGKENDRGSNKRRLVQNSNVRKENSFLVTHRESIARISTKSEAPHGKPTPTQLIREAEQKYLAAIAMLSRDANSRRSQIDEKTAMRFERTLAAIDRTITDTRHAVREHPGDPVAAQYMLAAYARKVDVLREMIGY